MFYLVNEKDISLFAEKVTSLDPADSLTIFCRDMEKAVFSGKDLQHVLEIQKIIPVTLQNVASKEEEIFLIGGMVVSGPVTLVNIDVPVPAFYKDKVTVMVLSEKKPTAKRSTRGRKKKVEPADDGGSE